MSNPSDDDQNDTRPEPINGGWMTTVPETLDGGWGTPTPASDGELPIPEALPATQDDLGAHAIKPAEPYEVGYGKPPKHSRWAKGQSGNRKGASTKKRSSLKERIQAKLRSPVKTTGGKSLTMADALVEVLFQGLAGKGGRTPKMASEVAKFLEKYDTEVDFVATPADEERLEILLRLLPPPKDDDDEAS